MTIKQVDILIIGGGLIGATLMLALKGLGYTTLLVDNNSFAQQENPHFDGRSLALSPASRHILDMLGMWDLLIEFVNPIEAIHVSEQGGFGITRLQAKAKEQLGYVVELAYINQVLHRLLDPNQILTSATLTELIPAESKATIQTATETREVCAQLIVAADGAHSTVRSLCAMSAEIKDFAQQAVVANIGLTKKHNNRAFERFTPEGPLALLPMLDNKMSLVWAMNPKRAERMMSVDDSVFLKELQRAFGYRLGRFSKVGKRFSYPLQQLVMPEQIKWPVVFVGNAAHTLHPIAGQGFNLGLRDVAMLAQCIGQQGINKQMGIRYQQLRRRDQKQMIHFTSGLVDLFTSRIPGMKVVRDLGLIFMDNSRVLKRCLSRSAQGYGGVIPDLVCQIPIESSYE